MPPVADVNPITDWQFLRLAVGVVNDIGGDSGSIFDFESGPMKEMEFLTPAVHFDSFDVRRRF